MADTIVSADVEVTSAQAAAVAALAAAGTTGSSGAFVRATAPTITGATVNELTPAIITRISLLEYICANDFDPPTTGIAGALVGARCSSLDGTKCWQKYGAAVTAWKALHETRGSVTAAGGPLSALDLTIAAATNQRVEISVTVLGTSTTTVTPMRINGSQVSELGVQVYNLGVGGAGYPIAGISVADGVSRASVDLYPVVCGFRLARWVMGNGVAANSSTGSIRISTGAITSVGIASASTAIGNGSIVEARVWTP